MSYILTYFSLSILAVVFVFCAGELADAADERDGVAELES